MKKWILSISIALVVICTSFAFASDLGGYTFLKISGSDARAVVQTPEGEKQLVSLGDMLGKAKIIEIGDDQVVLEQSAEQSRTLLIVRLVDGRQQISKIERTPAKQKKVSGAGQNFKHQAGSIN